MLNVIQGLKQIRLDLFACGDVCAAARAARSTALGSGFNWSLLKESRES